MPFSDDMAAYVRDTYSDEGVEIEGTGAGRIRLRMPPEFHDVTRLAQELCVRFGGRMDLVIDDAASNCVILEVYESQADGQQATEAGESFCSRAVFASAPVVVAALGWFAYTGALSVQGTGTDAPT